MSYVDKEILRGVGDALISTSTSTFPFTTTQLIRDSITQFGSYIRSFRIVNNDLANPLTYRQGAADAPLKSIPLQSEVVVEGWESYIEINPNGTSGAGFLELDLVNRFKAMNKSDEGQKIDPQGAR